MKICPQLHGNIFYKTQKSLLRIITNSFFSSDESTKGRKKSKKDRQKSGKKSSDKGKF